MSLMPRSSLLDSFFDDTFPAFRLMPEAREGGNLAVDIRETDDKYILHADFPGVKKEDINVTVENNMLTLSAERREEKSTQDQGRVVRQERRYGKYTRSFSLGKDVDEANIKATFDNGVLTLELPKAREEAPTGKQIPIT